MPRPCTSRTQTMRRCPLCLGDPGAATPWLALPCASIKSINLRKCRCSYAATLRWVDAGRERRLPLQPLWVNTGYPVAYV